ncbi:MAG: class I SAM-dependent methyltransferase [Clostridiales bacterium]|nr:class I SAM-dependent methyltransferase [Clostridiales bacterium]
MKKLFYRIYSRISSVILRLMDEASDRRICGQSLVKYVKSVYRDDANGVGMTGSQSTHYIILKRIFSHVTMTEQDSFMDIGCGKGRVLAFLLKRHAPCRLSGVEINEVSGKVAKEWTKKYEQVSVTLGDAFEMDYEPYTILFMGRPFLPKTFLQFIETFEAGLTHPITLIYWVDQQSGYLLKDRPGWEMHFREKLSTIRGLKISKTPQSYSIWTYDPARRG